MLLYKKKLLLMTFGTTYVVKYLKCHNYTYLLLKLVLVADHIWFWVKRKKENIQDWRSVDVQSSSNGRTSGIGGCVASSTVHASVNKLLHSQHTPEEEFKRRNKF